MTTIQTPDQAAETRDYRKGCGWCESASCDAGSECTSATELEACNGLSPEDIEALGLVPPEAVLTEILPSDQDELLAAIEADEVGERSQRLMSEAVECCSYTTTALKAMAAWLASVDDAEGAELVLRFAAEMARHEAVTL